MKIKLDYIARVEGEATVKLDIKDGRLNDLKLNIWEPPRFFEGFLKGRKFDEVPDIVARICGLCPVSHMTTAIRALEKCLSITPSPEAVRLRKVMALSQTVSSHLVHLYMLALPDYFRFPSVVEMIPDFKNEISRLIRMKEILNGITSLFGGGRALHPVAMTVSGFTCIPSKEKIGISQKGLEDIRGDALATLDMVAGLGFPDFKTDLEFVALKSAVGYAVDEGRVVSNKGMDIAEGNYRNFFEESESPYSNAKKTTVKGRGALMAGALARVNLNFDMLHPEAVSAAKKAGAVFPSANPFHNNIAQAVEVVHGINELIGLLDNVTEERPWVDIKVKEGEGGALTEAPRGLLYHRYVINRRGTVEKADIVTPTAHNSLGMEENLRRFVAEHIGEAEEELSLKCEMLVRAYDPCFSCSVH